MNLKDIIKYSKANKAVAQRALFDLTCDHLKSVAMRYVIDTQSAEDVLQESYIRIFQSLKKFEYVNDAATYGWLKKITSSEALRYLKKNKRRKEVLTQSSEKEYNSTVKQSHALFQDELSQMLLKLPDNQRLVFNMNVLEGYSHKEIADHLNIAESSSRSLLTRARNTLQSLIIKNDSYATV